ncbi:MAG: flap structure-specific endonuclease, partial [Candidatus Bathyarchaeota archaeon]|nr:flap structure-specific endonuclease [Candidatus Bathyarchaeota archaeon]
EARMYAQMTSRLKDYMTEDSKWLLKTMGVPWIQAPSEGEAQAAHVVKNGDADFCASQDYDSLLFGAPRLLRNVTISGRRKLPRKKVYIEVIPEVIDLERVLKELSITHEQLIDIGILVGTDFNPDGVKGVGVKTGLKLIKKHGSLDSALQELEQASFPAEPRRIREIFLRPRVTDNYRVFWREPKIEEAVDFLSGERDFSKDRVTKALEKAIAGSKKASTRTTLERWFQKP